MMLSGLAVVSASLLNVAFGTTGIDLSTSSNEFSCLHSDGIDFTITRAWYSYGAFDSSSITNLDNAKNAGIEYNDVYMFPCRGDSASTQVTDLVNDLKSSGLWGPITESEKNELKKSAHKREKRNLSKKLRNGNRYVPKGLQAGFTKEEKEEIKRYGTLLANRQNKNTMNFTIKNIINKDNNNNNSTNKEIPEWRKDVASGATYGMIWFDIEENPSSGCSWASYSSTSNCEYLGQLISAGVANSASIGVYSSEGEWENVMGSKTACSDYTKYPLWYAHYDGSQSFSDFSEYGFGGWSKPAIKQYEGDKTLCSTGVDLDYY